MLIVFDLDGTLFQTALCVTNALNAALNEINLPAVNDEIIISHIGKKTDEFLKAVLPDDIEPSIICERFRKLERSLVAEKGCLFPNVEKMLSALKQRGHNLVICSNGSIEYIDLVLECTQIGKYFSGRYSAKAYASKADAVKSITENEPAVIVGDTLSDYESASRNSLPSIAAEYGYGNREDLSAATFIARNPLEIADFAENCAVFYRIYEKISDKPNSIVGINGVDTSGKTTFTVRFSEFLKSLNVKNAVIHIDDFHNPSAVRNKGADEIESYYANAFDYPKIVNEILAPLKKEFHIDKHIVCLNLDTDRYDNSVHFNIDEQTILLVEGVLLFRPPLLDYFDLKIYLDIDFSEVIRRATARDVPIYGESFLQKYANKYIPVQKRYINEFQPQKNADILIDNNDPCYPRVVN